VTLYRWITIDAGAGFEQLEGILPSEFQPKKVVQRLREGLTAAVKGVLVEFDYVDKDYRSTFYNYYAKKGRKYRSDCVRMHLFDETVKTDADVLSLSCPDDRLSDHYYGYIVLRPTLHATIGRSLLSPAIRQGAEGNVITSTHRVHVLGYKLEVTGFPSMDQHVDIAVCAHVACWSVLRHYSQRFPRHAEFLLQDITRMAHPFDPGGLVPSYGLDIAEAERVFQAAATFPLVLAKDKAASSSFYAQLLAYLESGFPLFVGMTITTGGHEVGHAVVVVGNAFDFLASQIPTTPGGGLIPAWQLVSHFTVADDNQLPYASIRGLTRAGQIGEAAVESEPYSAAAFDRFSVALPEKIYYSAAAVEKLAPVLATKLLGLDASEHICRFFVTTLSRFREEIRKNASQYSSQFLQMVMNLPAAQFLWIVEFASKDEWAVSRISGRAVIDATAGIRDPNPVWFVHTQTTAIVFDRSDAGNRDVTLDITPAHGAPLTRMDLNMRPIARTN